MVLVHKAACNDRTVDQYTRGSKPHSEEVRQSILTAGFQIVTQKKKEEETMKQRYNLSGKKYIKAEYRCCTCHKHVCLALCLLISTDMMDESTNKTNMSKLHTHYYNVCH